MRQWVARFPDQDDIIVVFDDRSRLCRRTFESVEDKSTGPNHTIAELCLVFRPPEKEDDARMPKREVSLSRNATEIGYVSLPIKRERIKVQSRAEFNTCGEQLTSATTYTGVDMRLLDELPRMDFDKKREHFGCCSFWRSQKPCGAKGCR